MIDNKDNLSMSGLYGLGASRKSRGFWDEHQRDMTPFGKFKFYLDLHLASIFMFTFLVITALAMIGLGFSIERGAEEREAFMAECLQDRKQYECTALYKGGNSGAYSVVTPVIVPVRVK